MTKKEFFLQKVIPQVEEQIFNYEFQLIRNQYILERLERELKIFEETPVALAGEDVERAIKERARRKADLEEQIEEVKRNIVYLPTLREEERNFLEYLKNLVAQMKD